eukprot:12312953-Alexandrium_andersonii.AAC.1
MAAVCKCATPVAMHGPVGCGCDDQARKALPNSRNTIHCTILPVFVFNMFTGRARHPENKQSKLTGDNKANSIHQNYGIRQRFKNNEIR